MPIYEYKCNDCGHLFERVEPMRSLKRPRKQPCPECEAHPSSAKRVTSLPAPAQFKGSGFHATDYAAKKK